jgi:hypothetical protein
MTPFFSHVLQIEVVGGDLTITDSTFVVRGAATSSDTIAAVMFNNGNGTLRRVHFNGIASGSGAMLGACAGVHIHSFFFSCTFMRVSNETNSTCKPSAQIFHMLSVLRKESLGRLYIVKGNGLIKHTK